MDTSSSSSPRIRVVTANSELREPLTASEMARLLFDEVKDLAEKNMLTTVTARGRETGVPVDFGRQTVRLSRLGIPADMTSTYVTSSNSYIETGSVYSETKHGVEHQRRYGVLSLGCDADGHAHWLWSLVWMPFGQDAVCRVLDEQSLAELMMPDGDNAPILEAFRLYSSYLSMLERKLDWSLRFGAILAGYVRRTLERRDRLGVMNPMHS